ncbi:hypothetical protein KW456_04520 [Vibrio fluvialis]|nr:hypothetical protein [Vibrio fluvialis]
MTYPNTVISMPSQLFTMRSSFKAVANGSVYIGEVDTDPTIPTNQIQVYIEQENGMLVPVAQPIKINSAGLLTASGQVQKFVLTNTEYSMTVQNSYGVDEFYFPRVYDQGISAALEVEERAIGVGVEIYKGGNGQYVENGDVVPAGTTHLTIQINGKTENVAMSPVASGVVSNLTETGATIGGVSVTLHRFRNGGYQATDTELQTIIPLLGQQWVNTTDNTIHMGDGVTKGGIKQSYADVKHFGAKGDGITDDTIAIQAAIDSFNGSGVVRFPVGKYRISSPLLWRSGITLSGQSSQRPASGGSEIVSNSSDLIHIGDGVGLAGVIEGLKLTSEVGGGHIISIEDGLSRTEHRNLDIYQNNPDKSILHAVNLTIGYFGNWWHNINATYEADATVPAWNIITDGSATINHNVFEDMRTSRFPIQGGGDYAFNLETTSASTYCLSNIFKSITFQQPLGGAIRLRGCWMTTIDSCGAWDATEASTNPIIDIDAGPGGAISNLNVIKNCFLRVGFGTTDIKVNTQISGSLLLEANYIGQLDGNGGGSNRVVNTHSVISTITECQVTSYNGGGPNVTSTVTGQSITSWEDKVGFPGVNDGLAWKELNGDHLYSYSQSNRRYYFGGTTPGAGNISMYDEGRFNATEIRVNGVKWATGSGSPNGILAAVVGSFYTNTDGGAGATFYVKESGSTGNTGWVAK